MTQQPCTSRGLALWAGSENAREKVVSCSLLLPCSLVAVTVNNPLQRHHEGTGPATPELYRPLLCLQSSRIGSARKSLRLSLPLHQGWFRHITSTDTSGPITTSII